MCSVPRGARTMSHELAGARARALCFEPNVEPHPRRRRNSHRGAICYAARSRKIRLLL